MRRNLKNKVGGSSIYVSVFGLEEGAIDEDEKEMEVQSVIGASQYNYYYRHGKP